MRHFCTYFDRNYLVKGLAMIRSLEAIYGEKFHMYVVTMDELSRVLIEKFASPRVTAVPMHLLEELDHDLLATKRDRSAVEYLWTTTPTIILRLLERHPELDLLTYVDADLFFYHSPEPLFEELSDRAVMIHEHRFPPAFKYQEEHGIFNVGLLIFRNNAEGMEVLQWWRARCLEWCYARVEEGKFGDQGYLNDWPQRFPQVVVTQHIGAGVAPWNDDQYRFTSSPQGLPLVDEVPVIFYHFHSFTFLNPALVVPTRDQIYTPSYEIAKSCLLPYIQALQAAIIACRNIVPEFECGVTSRDFALAPGHALLCHRSLESELAKLSIPHTPMALDGEWRWYSTENSATS